MVTGIQSCHKCPFPEFAGLKHHFLGSLVVQQLLSHPNCDIYRGNSWCLMAGYALEPCHSFQLGSHAHGRGVEMGPDNDPEEYLENIGGYWRYGCMCV